LKVDRDKFLIALNKRLDDINQVQANHSSVPIEKVVLYLLDIVKRGTFDGIVSIKIKESMVYSPRSEEDTSLNREYVYVEQEKIT
jgi:hypothetical protein